VKKVAVETWSCQTFEDVHEAVVSELAVSANYIAASDRAANIIVYDAVTTARVFCPTENKERNPQLFFANDDNILYATKRGLVLVFDCERQELVRRLDWPDTTTVCMSQDRQLLVGARQGGGWQCYDAHQLSEVLTVTSDDESFENIACSPSGGLIANFTNSAMLVLIEPERAGIPASSKDTLGPKRAV